MGYLVAWRGTDIPNPCFVPRGISRKTDKNATVGRPILALIITFIVLIIN